MLRDTLKRLLPDSALEALRDLRAPRNALTDLANEYGSDKGTRHFMRHNYTRVYEPLFQPFRDSRIRFLEIGLLNIADRAWKNRELRLLGKSIGGRAPSLEMWSRYFPQSEVFGFDINDFPNVSIPRVKIVRGDMGNRDDLRRLLEETGDKQFDIIIEDASHASHHQQIALGFLFQHIKPGGLYIIEDLQFQPQSIELPDAVKTLDVLEHFQRTGRIESEYILANEAHFIAENVASLRLFDSVSPKEGLRGRDALAVLQRKSA